MTQGCALLLLVLCLVLFAINQQTAIAMGEEQGQQPADNENTNLDSTASDSEAGSGDGEDLGDISEEKMAEMMKQLEANGMGGMGMGMGGMGMGGFGGMGGGRRYTRDILPVEEDVPHVQCETCKELIKEVQRRVSERQKKLKKTKVTELEILEMLETICDPVTGDGEWITEFDIIEKDDALILEHRGQPGHCEEECKTIVKACDNIVKEADSDMAELIYVNKPDVTDKVCAKLIKQLKGACGQPPLPIRADRTPGGDNFKPKSEIDIALAEAGKDLRKRQEINPDFLRDDL